MHMLKYIRTGIHLHECTRRHMCICICSRIRVRIRIHIRILIRVHVRQNMFLIVFTYMHVVWTSGYTCLFSKHLPHGCRFFLGAHVKDSSRLGTPMYLVAVVWKDVSGQVRSVVGLQRCR